MKEIRAGVLAALQPWRATSRLEIAAATGLSPATVSRVTRELVRAAILTEIVKKRPSVGRPEHGLELCGDRGAVLGVSLLPPTAHALAINLRGDVLARSDIELPTGAGVRGVLEPLRKGLSSLLRRWPSGAPKPARVSVALPGQWNREDGVSLQFPRVPEWRNVQLKRLVEEWTSRPVTMVGYAAAMAQAEQARRAEGAPRNLIAVEVGEHVAMGAVVGGTVLEGASGSAGELGHITVDAAGPVCYCGNRGCLEMLATCGAVEDEVRGSDVARRVFPNGETARFEDVVEMARAGEPFAARLLARVAKTLGVGLAAAVNLFNPELLVLSGRFFGAGDLVLEPLRSSLLEHALPNTTRRLLIEPSGLAPSAAALGAGAVAIGEVIRAL